MWNRDQCEPRTKLIVTGYIFIEANELSQFHAELQELAVSTRQRPGNLSYGAAVDDQQAGRLLIVERWRDQTALTAHLEADETIAFVQRWQGRMQGDIRKYDAANERALTAEG